MTRPRAARSTAPAAAPTPPSAGARTSRPRPVPVPVASGARHAGAAPAAVVVVVAAVLALGVSAVPAWAHDALIGSEPADGASVGTAPASVELSFSQPPLALGSEVQVTGPDGQVVDAGDLVLAGTTVSQPLAPGLPAGEYDVVWRVTSADGHPISGELTFTAAGGAESGADPAPTAEPVPTEGPTEPPAVSPGTGAGDDAGAGAAGDGAAAGDVTDDDGRGVAPWVVGALLLLAAGAAAWWAARRRSAGTQA